MHTVDERAGSVFRRLLQEPARPRSISSRPDAYWFAVATVCIGAFMGQLDASIVTLAFRPMKEHFGVSLGAIQWVGLTYLLVLVVALPMVGRLADMVGRKLLYTYGFTLFIIGSFLCGVAPSLGALDLFRALQALGAAMLQANSVAIIAGAMPPHKLGQGIGIQGGAQALGLALGPVAGGVLIALGGWRWIFFVNVPAGIIGTILGWYLIPRSRNLAGRAQFDLPGAATLAPAIASLFLALSLGDTYGWGSPLILGLLGIAVVGLMAFGFVERRSAAPMVQMALLRVRRFTLGVGSGVLIYLITFSVMFVAPFLLEVTLHLDSARAGLVLLAMPAALGLVAPFAGRLSDRWGARPLTSTGMGLAALSVLLLAWVHGSVAVLAIGLAFLGAGLGAANAPNNASTIGAAPPQHSGVASGVLNMGRGIGTALGLSVTALVLQSVAGAAKDPTLVAKGFQISMWVLAVAALVTIGLTALQGEGRLASREELLHVE